MKNDNFIATSMTKSGSSSDSQADSDRSQELRSPGKRILHVYPAKMFIHLATMIENTNVVFSEFENQTVLVAPGERDAKFSKFAKSKALRILSPASILLLIGRRRFDFVVFHSDHWPKFWIVASLAILAGSRPIWIPWSGELQSSGGVKSRINAGLKSWTIPRFNRCVFLAASDQVRAEKLCGRNVRSIVIPYYNPSYLGRSSLSSERNVDSSIVRVQIGNSGEEDNGHLACLAELSRVRNLAFTVVYPLGYHSAPGYIERLKTASKQSAAVSCELIDRLLPFDEFDRLIDSCDALLLASHRQRALYSIYRYLAAGKPVFLPKDAEIRRDLEATGFEVQALESLGSMSASEFSCLCKRKCGANISVAQEHLGLEGIRRKWANVIAEVTMG